LSWFEQPLNTPDGSLNQGMIIYKGASTDPWAVRDARNSVPRDSAPFNRPKFPLHKSKRTQTISDYNSEFLGSLAMGEDESEFYGEPVYSRRDLLEMHRET
jgi:hypothetical protein